MLKIKSLLKKAIAPAVLALPALNALAQGGTAPTITPQESFTKSDLSDRILGIVNYVLGIVAVVAVAMIIYAGFLYITAGMDDAKVGKAKNTLLYGVIGVIVAALAFAIVSFASSFITA